ncbi:MAG: InlB B-repeat-containing protein, partial [Clostridia bacterium]|nr:InlB B-repeat-containing protein [Clostridia bacterium]
DLTVEFCGRADGGSVVIYQPQENAKIHMYNNAKITGLYAQTSCIIRLIMQDSAEIGEVKNIDFRSLQLSGNAKFGTADSSFSIKAYEKSAGITIKDNVKLFGTVTVQLDDDATFTLEGKASITGELIVKKSGKTGNRATVVMAGESAVHGKLTCRDDAITFEMQDSATIDGDIDLGGAQVNGKVICTGDIIDGIFNGDVENNGRIIDGIFYGKVTGNGTIEDSAKVDFSFNTNGGDAVVKQRILRGQKAQKPTAISKAGYIFDSWQLGGAIFDFATPPITEDTTITAVWTQCDHSGSTAHPTCTASATCTVCAGKIAAIGHSPETGYKHDETSHWIACRNCNEELNKASHAGTDDGDCTTAVLCEECKYIITAARSSHTWDAWTSNGNNTHTNRCTVKGCMAGTETENCSGGTATCLKLAECDYCKQKYGNINSGNHVNLRKIPAVASTAISKGNIEYFVCDDCKKFFADEKGTKEITLADTITEKAAPTIIFGADSKWYRYGANEYLEFRSEALYADFISVSIDGKLLDESQYEKSEGSIIIRIKADYLNSILTGKHTVTITSVSGDANANFIVTFPDADVPTGDSFIIWLASFAA